MLVQANSLRKGLLMQYSGIVITLVLNQNTKTYDYTNQSLENVPGLCDGHAFYRSGDIM
ncbi:hypothetical protein C7460_104311 [Marinoscillum furvescens DSM 4134]|uniref:Uncharacterized protein n=1 Tax=Marinoscillum furvescens DSM 4134 TaxID=1122208 RepID=A0A3D9L845_MARFU|nr:hypothetical protein C7460_104311 [Marinoscillum furvescens DSM 4134]